MNVFRLFLALISPNYSPKTKIAKSSTSNKKKRATFLVALLMKYRASGTAPMGFVIIEMSLKSADVVSIIHVFLKRYKVFP